MDTTKNLKAYTWNDEYAECGYVIYAASAGKARGGSVPLQRYTVYGCAGIPRAVA